MTTVDGRAADPRQRTEPRAGVRVVLASSWEGSRLLRVLVDAETSLSCVVTEPRAGLSVLHDVAPQRRDELTADLLVAAAAHVRSELGADVLAIHPAEWDDVLAPGGMASMHGAVHLALLLADDHLQLHPAELPDGFSLVPLCGIAADDLAALGPPEGGCDDLTSWQDLRRGGYGQLLSDASVAIRAGDEVCAAVGVSRLLGRPLIGRCVTSPRRRGEGLGRAALLTALHRLRRSGEAECRVFLREDDWISRRLFRSVGFAAVTPPLRVGRLARDDARDPS